MRLNLFTLRPPSPYVNTRRSKRYAIESLENRALLTTNLIDVYESAPAIVASDADPNDQFGFSSEMTNDGKIAVVGANHDDQLGTDAGAVYLLHNDGAGWTKN